MSSFYLRICDNDNKFKLTWQIPDGVDTLEPPAYSVDAGTLQQTVIAVREQLRDIAFATSPIAKQEFAEVLERLAQRGSDLFQELLPDSEGYQFDLKQRLQKVSQASSGERYDLKIILETDRLLVPWGFAFSGDVANLPDAKALSLSLADMKGFWLSHFNISITYSGNLPLPSERKTRACKLFALHSDMFAAARRSLEQDPKLTTVIDRLDQILDENKKPTVDWTSFFDQWGKVGNEDDAILCLYGHSDGQRIELRDKKREEEIEDDPKFDLLAANFKKFRKRPDGSASIFLLNGCRTAAPEPGSRQIPISTNFLKETRTSGYFGFIGTEAQVSNVFACRYGAEFMWRLFQEGRSVGEAFDELFHDDSLFPQNLLYSCYAERKFRLASILVKEKDGD